MFFSKYITGQFFTFQIPSDQMQHWRNLTLHPADTKLSFDYPFQHDELRIIYAKGFVNEPHLPGSDFFLCRHSGRGTRDNPHSSHFCDCFLVLFLVFESVSKTPRLVANFDCLTLDSRISPTGLFLPRAALSFDTLRCWLELPTACGAFCKWDWNCFVTLLEFSPLVAIYVSFFVSTVGGTLCNPCSFCY